MQLRRISQSGLQNSTGQHADVIAPAYAEDLPLCRS